jgi:hypothetical protein
MMTDVQTQAVGTKQQVAVKRSHLLIALGLTIALAVMSLVALVIVAVTDEETVVTKTETVTNTRVVPLRVFTPQEIANARSMKDEMSLAIGLKGLGARIGDTKDDLRLLNKAEILGFKPGDTKDDLK